MASTFASRPKELNSQSPQSGGFEVLVSTISKRHCMNNDEFYDSLDFQELLRKYEQAKQQGQMCYFDSDEFIDIAEYYLDNDQLDQMLEASEHGLALHPDEDYLVSLKVNALISLHRFDEARQMLHSIDPEKDHDYYYFKGQLLATKGNNEEANKYFRQWIQHEQAKCEEMTNRAESRERMKDAYFHIIVSFIDLGTSHDQQPTIHFWIDEYQKTFAPLDGDDTDIDIARCCHDADLTDDEIAIYSQCLDSNPYMPQGWTYLSSLQHVQGLIDDSINSAENALAVAPDDIHALIVRAHGLFDKHNFASALPDYQRYYEQTGDDAVLMAIGRCQMELGLKQEGLETLHKAREYCTHNNKDKSTQAYNRGFIADALTIGGFFKEALAVIRLAIRTFPDDVDFHIQKARIHLAMENAEDAVEEYMRAAINSDTKVNILMSGAGDLMEHDYYRAAVFLLLMAEKEQDDPEHVKVYPYLTHIAAQLGQNELAISFLDKACQYAPDVVGQLWENDLIGIAPDNYYNTLLQILLSKKR